MIEPGADERYCHNCGAPTPETHSFCLRCGVRINLLRPLPTIADRLPGRYPIRFDVEYPQRLSRLLIFVKWWLLAIPQLLIVYALGTVSGVIGFVAWFAILFTRRYPKGLFEVVVGFNRWSANVISYIGLLRDEYPPYSTDPGRYALRYEVDYPEKLNRWLIFVKWLLVIPHYVVLYILFFIAVLMWFIGWFAILFTGRFPRGMFDFIVGVMRWYYRVTGYTSLLRDEFPPYSMAAEAGPGTRRSVILSAIAGFVIVPVAVGGFIALSTIDASETHEVPVSYADALSGRPTLPIDVEGTEVILTRAQDPATLGQARTPRPGQRYVRFQLEITNYSAPFTSVARRTFSLEDSRGRDHTPETVQGVPAEYSLSRNETVNVSVVFEIAEEVEPSSLTYSPGFAAFFPLGERVRFEFTDADVFVPLDTNPLFFITPSPQTSPRIYQIDVAVDDATPGPFASPVSVGPLEVFLREVKDPDPPPPRLGARHVEFIFNIRSSEAAPSIRLDAADFQLTDSQGAILQPHYFSFGGQRTIDRAELSSGNAILVYLSFIVEESVNPVHLMYRTNPVFVTGAAFEPNKVRFEFR